MNDTPSAPLLASLRRGEGLRLKAYADPKSGGAPWTIAYGRAGRCSPGDTCTKAQAEAWLQEDAQKAVDILHAKLPWTGRLGQVRFDVLAEMLYNMGWRSVDAEGRAHGLSTFVNTLAAIERGDFARAADGMLASGWARDVKGRADRLAQAMRTGVRP